MREKVSSGGGSMVGGSSLLIIFAVLCLTIFALLSLNTAAAGARLSKISAEAASDYYAAELQAEEILAGLRAGEVPEDVDLEDGVYRYTCPISDTQALEAAVRIGADGRFTVLRWQSVSTADWEADPDLKVWDGTVE